MILHSLEADPVAFASRSGWEAKPEGLCRGEVCVPAPGAKGANGLLDVNVVSDRLQMPLVHDETHNVWALGPSAAGVALASAVAADPTLIDRNGASFQLSSLRGRRVIMVAWASW